MFLYALQLLTPLLLHLLEYFTLILKLLVLLINDLEVSLDAVAVQFHTLAWECAYS